MVVSLLVDELVRIIQKNQEALTQEVWSSIISKVLFPWTLMFSSLEISKSFFVPILILDLDWILTSLDSCYLLIQYGLVVCSEQ